ncbi:hypothetical protein APSETT445_001486 [Aspergillus pseudonomiae]
MCAIDGQLGQHQTTGADGEPLLNDPRFLTYEKTNKWRSSVIAISITRMAMYFHVGTTFMEHYNDETYYTSPVFFWTNIEISLAVILACLPTLRPLWVVIRGRPVTFGSKSYEPYSSSRQSGRSARNHKRIPDTVNELDTINLVERYPEV